MRLLAPAGNMESLRAAVLRGADEVYLGVNDYNARNNIEGFGIDTLAEAVDYAHVYGVKVCLALNILFEDAELADALALAVKAWELGVDAFIVQDLGLARLMHDLYPNMVLHASTQMGIHNLEGVRAIQPFGFRRVVLARETPLSEVRRIRQGSDVEIEYFVQGALCVSFSGNCYLSQRLLNASGNRGKCKQLCRLPYTLEKGGRTLANGYLLSAKDLCLIDRLAELEAVGVDVLKIEGRARRPSYVALTTAEYYKALHGMSYDVDRLRLAFHRLYTPAYLEGNGAIISTYNNHIGLVVGRVDRVVAGKKFNEVYLTCDRELTPKSVLKLFEGETEANTLTAYDLRPLGKGRYCITTTQQVTTGARVHLISDPKVEEEALGGTRERLFKVCIVQRVGCPVVASCTMSGVSVEVTGAVCQAAQNQPITQEQWQGNFDKNEWFALRVHVEGEDVFLPKSACNALRRAFVERLLAALVEPYRHHLTPAAIPAADPTPNVTAATIERWDAPLTTACVIYSPDVYDEKQVARFADRCREQGVRPYLDTPYVAFAEDVALLENIVAHTQVGVVANNWYALGLGKDILVGYGLNVYNAQSAAAIGHPVLSPASPELVMPYMVLRHCPYRNHLGAKCAACPHAEGYRYVMGNGRVLTLKRKKAVSCTFYLV